LSAATSVSAALLSTREGYPAGPAERTRWIVERRPRGERPGAETEAPHGYFVERERMADGKIAEVATVLLVNRECPWRCLMCDLWRNTSTASRTTEGMIPRQIEHALERLPSSPKAKVIKLYNSGSFFDDGAIPRADWRRIAALCRGFARVVVECHPRLVGPAVRDFAEMIEGKLEVAMGLETCHPAALEALNKRFTLEDFRRAAAFLAESGADLRTFLLVHPPLVPREQAMDWAEWSAKFAFDCGSGVVSFIPTREGNGALDALAARGEFQEPSLAELEEAQEWGLALKRGRIFADTWDLGRFARCGQCAEARIARIGRMNLSQALEPRAACEACGG